MRLSERQKLETNKLPIVPPEGTEALAEHALNMLAWAKNEQRHFGTGGVLEEYERTLDYIRARFGERVIISLGKNALRITILGGDQPGVGSLDNPRAKSANVVLWDGVGDQYYMEGNKKRSVPVDYGASDMLDSVEKITEPFEMILDSAQYVRSQVETTGK